MKYTLTITNAADFDMLDVAIGEALTDAGIKGTVEAVPAPSELTRFYKGSGSSPSSETMTVADLMDENGDFEDSAWTYMQDVVQFGYYDDSDWPSEVFSYYTATNGVQPIIDAASAWYDANPEIVDEQDLNDPRTWKVGR